jgi:hypothetical protein
VKRRSACSELQPRPVSARMPVDGSLRFVGCRRVLRFGEPLLTRLRKTVLGREKLRQIRRDRPAQPIGFPRSRIDCRHQSAAIARCC